MDKTRTMSWWTGKGYNERSNASESNKGKETTENDQ